MASCVTPAWTAILVVQSKLNQLQERYFDPINVLELQYMEILNSILNKPNWWEKIENPEIVAKWMQEIDQQLNIDALPYSDDMVMLQEETAFLTLSKCQAFLMDELKDLSARVQSKPGPVISPTTALGVFISDQIMPWSLNDAVKHLSSLLTADIGDMRLSGNSQVLDLIHPSLYCLRYDNTMMSHAPLRAFGEKAIAKSGAIHDDSISKKYMWLPSEFAVNEGKVTIRSYINNLNPRLYWNMYPVIAQVFEHVLPMFHMTMEALNFETSTRISLDSSDVLQSKDEYIADLWAKYKAEHENDPEDDPNTLSEDEFNDQAYENLYDDDTRCVNIPSLPDYKPDNSHIAYPDIFDTSKYKQQNLQVVVKMSAIELTPENPSFKGGSWHLEGMVNEAIIATAIYYYDIENITESRLSFRHIFDPTNLDYEQNDHRGVEAVYGIQNNVSDNVQPSGFILAKPNRCVVFPNCHHHRVEPFELADKTKKGHRKIFCFFLVDPSVRVPSTMFVPPQQKEEVHRILRHCLPRKLNDDLVVIILNFVPGLLTKEEAIHHAHELSEERKISDREGYPGVSQIFLCEH
jgi:hypothetical protein